MYYLVLKVTPVAQSHPLLVIYLIVNKIKTVKIVFTYLFCMVEWKLTDSSRTYFFIVTKSLSGYNFDGRKYRLTFHKVSNYMDFFRDVFLCQFGNTRNTYCKWFIWTECTFSNRSIFVSWNEKKKSMNRCNRCYFKWTGTGTARKLFSAERLVILLCALVILFVFQDRKIHSIWL